MRIAVTGSTGFIGSTLMPAIVAAGHEAVPVGRGEIADRFAYEHADVAVHLAGLAHRTGPAGPHAAAYDVANAELPVTAYGAARAAGVRRFIQVSTIGVLSGHRGIRRETMQPAPTTAYDKAKAKAEQALAAEAARGGPELAIVRPVLVHGPGAKGNLDRLMRLCDRPIPLPFGAIRNRRSLVGVENLADALIFLSVYASELLPPAIFHVTDGEPLSLRDLVSAIRAGLGRRPGLLPMPAGLVRAGLALSGRGDRASALLDDLVVEASELADLGWLPPVPAVTGIEAMARAFAEQRRAS